MKQTPQDKKRAAKKSLKRVIISLFDRQKDYGEIRGKQGKRKMLAPSIAIAWDKFTTNATRYVLLFEPRYETQAKSLIKDINSAMRQNRRGATDPNVTHEEINRVIPLSVHYDKDDVWNLDSTTNAINQTLCKLESELKEYDFKLYVNMVNGTAEQRTALALWAFRTARARAGMTIRQDGPSPIRRPVADCFFARLQKEITDECPLEFVSAKNPKKHFGFLQCKFNSQNPPLKATLSQLEVLLKHVHIGLDDTLLFTGPSGAGKTMLAKMCMKFLQCLHPEIKDENCVHINMSAISEELFESELFGHVKGSYTGATEDKEGLVARANGGVLFLDEVGELPLHLQAKLLTFLDTGDYRKVGDPDVRHSNFLLICGTNRDLESAIPDHFRRDLYERINMWHFNIPGLRERPEDLEPAIRRALAIWNDTKKTGLHFAPDAMQELLKHLKSIPLAGNYRELHAIVRRLMTLAQDSVIALDDVNREISPHHAGSAVLAPSNNTPLDYDLIDLAQLATALSVCRTAKSGREAGEMLFAATKVKNATFNGSAYFQRIFEKFGLRVKFKDGKFDTIKQQ